MRPALLVIIMDFLISSLLLYISGPGNLAVTASGRSRPDSFEPASGVFSPDAIASLEAQWQREYSEQMKDVKLLFQQKQIAHSQETTRELAEQKSELQSRIAGLSSDLVRRQEAFSNMAQNIIVLEKRQGASEAELKRIRTETETLAREKERLAVGKAGLEQALKNLGEAKAQAEQKLQEASRKQVELVGRVEKLQDRIIAQSETISRQHETISRQQQTIGGDLKNVAQIQSRIENKTDAIRDGQEQMQSALDDLNALLVRLPLELRESFRQVADDQKRIEAAMSGLERAAGAVQPASAADRKLISEKLGDLTKLQQGLQDNVRTMLASQTNAAGITRDIKAVREHQEAMREQIGDLVFKFDKMEIKQHGPFSRFKDSRLALSFMMTTAKRSGNEPAGDSIHTFSSVVYVPLFIAGNRVYAACHAADAGLDWSRLGKSLKEVSWTIALNERHPPLAFVQGPALVYPGDPRIISVDCSRDAGVGPGLTKLEQVRPMTLAGMAALDRRGTRDMYVFKRGMEEAGFAVEIAPEQDQPGYLAIRRSTRSWVSFLADHFLIDAASRPEAGDYVVTAEGTLVGIMVDKARCCVLSEEQLARPARKISLADAEGFVRDVAGLSQ